MKMINKITLSLAVASTIFFTGCNDSAGASKAKVAQPTISEESLGLRKTNLYVEEGETTGDKTTYGKDYAGSGHKFKRAFQDAPPMIPHDTEGMLPIKINNNQCVSCHMPDVASSMGATPIPVSHMTNFRPTHKYDGKKFEKSIDNMKNEMAIHKAGTKLVGARFNCSQCHAPQSTGKLAVENTFEAVYSDKDGASKSNWRGERMTYGLNTTGDESYVTDKDLHMESAAGHLKGGH